MVGRAGRNRIPMGILDGPGICDRVIHTTRVAGRARECNSVAFIGVCGCVDRDLRSDVVHSERFGGGIRTVGRVSYSEMGGVAAVRRRIEIEGVRAVGCEGDAAFDDRPGVRERIAEALAWVGHGCCEAYSFALIDAAGGGDARNRRHIADRDDV